jgi:hypothetical protein
MDANCAVLSPITLASLPLLHHADKIFSGGLNRRISLARSGFGRCVGVDQNCPVGIMEIYRGAKRLALSDNGPCPKAGGERLRRARP